MTSSPVPQDVVAGNNFPAIVGGSISGFVVLVVVAVIYRRRQARSTKNVYFQHAIGFLSRRFVNVCDG